MAPAANGVSVQRRERGEAARRTAADGEPLPVDPTRAGEVAGGEAVGDVHDPHCPASSSRNERPYPVEPP
jgi:hypothetical protein